MQTPRDTLNNSEVLQSRENSSKRIKDTWNGGVSRAQVSEASLRSEGRLNKKSRTYIIFSGSKQEDREYTTVIVVTANQSP